MRRNWAIFALIMVMSLAVGLLPAPALAQGAPPELALFTEYPVRVIEPGDSVTFDLKLRLTGTSPQIVYLDVQDLPEGWAATFRGRGDVVRAVTVEPDSGATVSLKLEPPRDVAGGAYPFTVIARNETVTAELPLEVTVSEGLPPMLELDVDLPTLRGTANATFRYDATLSNEGDEDLTVSLIAEAPEGFLVSFKLSAQEVTSLPLAAEESKRISIEVRPFAEVPTGAYPITIIAQGGEARATTTLVAEVTGRPDLTVTTPDERLSFQAYAGRETSLKILVQNLGSAPARNVELSAGQPSGWSVAFSPDRIAEIPVGQQVEVTVAVQPAEKAVAGDYMLTIYARPVDGTTESAEFRVTVLTSTLWGVVGIALIAVAVVVVALAVMRFGRR